MIIIAAAQNNVTRINIKVRIDKTQQNSKCLLCGDRDKMNNHIIRECCKLAQKEYKTRQGDPQGIVQEIKFDHMNKWYMHNPASVLKHETHKLLWDFDIQTDHLISARRPDLIIINKKKENLQNCGLCCPG